MPNAGIYKEGLPKRFWVFADLLFVLILGVIDYKTGDYLIIIFYMIPVVLGSWITGVNFGIALAVVSGVVRFCAEYATYKDLNFANYLIVAEDVIFLLVIAGITSLLHTKLEGKNKIFQDRKGKINRHG